MRCSFIPEDFKFGVLILVWINRIPFLLAGQRFAHKFSRSSLVFLKGSINIFYWDGLLQHNYNHQQGQ